MSDWTGDYTSDSEREEAEKTLSKGALLYLVWLCQRAIRGEYHSSIYNFYDRYQEFTHELAALGYVHVVESMDDEWGIIQRSGYDLVRSPYWLTGEQMAKLDRLFT